MNNLVNEFSRLSRFFKLKIESFSASEAAMLDARFSLRRTGDVCSFAMSPFTKPTSIWRPLSCHSMHHPSVHTTWPCEYMARLARRCTSGSQMKHYSQLFYDKFVSSCSQHTAIPRMRAQLRSITSVSRSDYSHGGTMRAASFPSSWIVIPFRPSWWNARLPKLIGDLNVLSDVGMPVRVAWSLGSSPLSALLQNTSNGGAEGR